MSQMPLVLIPCKSLAFGKSRLSTLLNAIEREAFCYDLLIHTLRLAIAAVGNANVRLVSTDPAAEQIAKGTGIESYTREWPDLNAALSGIREELVAMSHWSEVVVLPIDLPFATKAAIQSVIAEEADVTIVPDRKESGTNILMLRGVALAGFPFTYGESSFAAHGEAAVERGWKLSIRRIAELAFDIDEPEDYLEWKKIAVGSQQIARADNS